jgi:hypothetical protein
VYASFFLSMSFSLVRFHDRPISPPRPGSIRSGLPAGLCPRCRSQAPAGNPVNA